MIIRVNPDQLLSSSKSINNISSEIKHISEAVRNTANSAPSYNGQFGPKVKSIGNDAYSSGSRYSSALNSSSSDLSIRANKFINTENIKIISSSIHTMSSEKKNKGLFDLISDIGGAIVNTIFQVVEDKIEDAKEQVVETIEAVRDSWEDKLTYFCNLLGGGIELLGNLFGSDMLDQLGEYIQGLGQDLRAKGHWGKPDIPRTTEEERKDRYRREVPHKLRTDWEQYGCPIPGSDAYLLFLLQYYTSEESPVAIIENGENDYIVLIKGTNGKPTDLLNYFKDENGWSNNLAAFLGLQTGYESTILDYIKHNLPKGATIHLVGHSQGGIIANNCVADILAMEGMDFTVDSVTTFGSPPPLAYNLPDSVKYTYYAAKADPVPQLSSYLVQLIRLNSGVSEKILSDISDLSSVTKINLVSVLLERINQLTNEKLTYIEGYTHGMNVEAHNAEHSYLPDETLMHTTSSFKQNTSQMQVNVVSWSRKYQAGEISIDESLKNG